MSRLDDLNAELRNYGVSIDTYSPGDGVTRYRFFAGAELGYDYFAGNGVYTAHAWAEAQTFATGWARGMAQAYSSVGMHS